ncbi:hypothetical protein [Paraburkholderia sp. SOS3]|uniref:hypothetical protein n=1 Tax=Paraburkholderia sp. SOS3 TaxID=1926494 RepID=UPI000947332D|nr:hypothetical protein [Paraburkholderia sp. SOS3]APR40014.1 hypothetical protein BTO02_33270 [Paraburkholderia sp. SOS3]
MNAIFRDTRQALHVSFLVLSTDPRAKNIFRTALIQIMEMQPNLTARQQAWLDQLIGDASDSTVNFAGLSGDDVRAQCAAVVSAVRSKLPDVERWAVLARFGQMGDARMPDGVKRFYFLQERSEAIQNLSGWLAPSFDGVSMMALDCILARLYANHAKVDISFRDLAKSFGASHMTYKRAFDKISKRMREVENRAIDILMPYFERTGLIEQEPEKVA